MDLRGQDSLWRSQRVGGPARMSENVLAIVREHIIILFFIDNIANPPTEGEVRTGAVCMNDQ